MRMFNRWVMISTIALVPACGDKEGSSGASAEGGDKKEAAGDLRPVQVAAGLGASCARMSDGTVRCWGRNDGGEVGKAKEERDYATPVEVAGVKDAEKLWFGGDSGSSGDMGCVLSKKGTVTCWGSSQLMPKKSKDSDEKYEETAQPITLLEGAKDLALGGGTIYAITKDGKVMGWGSPAFNAFGNGDTGSFDQPMTEVPVEKAKALAAGQNHACALLEDGTVSCWGYVRDKQKPKAIEGLEKVTAIFAGSSKSDSCAIVEGGDVHCWSESQKPKKMEGLSGVETMGMRTHACAVDGKGDVYCWGSNDRGQLGDGKTKSNYTPTKVAGVSKAISVAAGVNTTCAATEGGEVLCWGYNRRGQLGDGTLMDREKPTKVVGIAEEKLPDPKDGTDEVQEADVSMDWSGLPDGCTKPTKIAGKSPKLAGDFEVASAYAKSQGDGKTITVDLANYKLDPKKWDPPRGEQFKLNLRFAHANVDKKEAKKVVPGEYVFALKEDKKVASSISHKAGGTTLMTLKLDGVSPGTVSITHLDDEWICGELKLKTKTSEFTGPYAARFVKR